MNYHVFHNSFTTVSLVTSTIRQSSIYSWKSLYKKTSQKILRELKASFKTGASKVPRPRPVLPSLLRPICQVCVNSQLSPTPAVVTKRKGEEERNKTNFSSCNERSPKLIINNYYIFFPKLWVWVFLFLRTPFFKTQHIGPMLLIYVYAGMYIYKYIYFYVYVHVYICLCQHICTHLCICMYV